MNVREEDRKKNNCPSRGLGLAAAAIGVGVGAALYYFFSKRPENPDAGGSTTQWSCEQPHTFSPLYNHEENNNSYITISENSTTDTSILTSDETDSQINETSNESSYSEEPDEDWFPSWSSVTSALDDDIDSSESDDSNSSDETPRVTSNMPVNNVLSDPDTDWDVTESSVGVPDGSVSIPSHLSALINNLETYLSSTPQRRKLTTEEARRRLLRDQAFRERSWSLEECSICFDVILKDQEVTTLPCTHNFHSECITPWLQEQQTCPNCRKAAE